MKKAIVLTSVIFCLFIFTGCSMLNKNASSGDKADTSQGGYDGAVIEYVKSDETSLTVKITNNTSSTWQSGNMRDYQLQVLNGEEWYRVEQIGEFANTMELMLIAPGESLTHTFEFKNRYGILGTGHYRVVKSFWANKTDTEEERSFALVLEFDV